MGLINRIAGHNLSGDERVALVTPQSNSLSVDTVAPAFPIASHALGYQWNETNWEFSRGNTSGTVRTSSSASATYTGSDLTNYNARGVLVFTNITQLPGSASTTWATKVQAKDPVGGGYIVIASGPARSASGLAALMVYPGISESSGALSKVNSAVPRDFRVLVSLSTGAANAGSSIFSVAIEYIL